MRRPYLIATLKNSILIAVLLTAIGLVITTGFTSKIEGLQTTNPQINIKDIQEHGISIIGPANSSFDGMIMNLTHGKQNTMVEALRPFSIFIKNTSGRTVVAFALKWEMMRPDGKIRTQTRDYITLWRLMGVTASNQDGYVIEPNAALFILPSNIEPVTDSNPGNLSDGNSASDISTEMSRYINITVTLDGVFFDDGMFVGPDTTGLFAEVEAERNAKRDLIREIKEELQQGKAKQQALKHADDLANGPELKLNPRSTPVDRYNKHKKDVAAAFLQMRKSAGDDKIVDLIFKQIREPLPELRKY